MKTTIRGNYSFRKPSKRKGTNALAFIGLILIFISLIAGTQYFAWNVGKNRLLNELFSYAGIRIYSPLEIIDWLKLWQTQHRDMGDFTDSLILMGGCAFMGVALIGIAVRNRNEKHDAGNLYGSAQYAELEEIREAGLLPAKGEKGKGVYVGGWINPKDGQQYYLRRNGKEHVIALAPTRSGKGVGLVIPRFYRGSIR